MGEGKTRSGYSLPPMHHERPALPKWAEWLVILLVLGATGLWAYGIVCLVTEKAKLGGWLIGAAAATFAIIFVATRGVVKRRQKKR